MDVLVLLFLQVIPYCLLDMITYMMGAYWYYACQVLSSAAHILADDFQMVGKLEN